MSDKSHNPHVIKDMAHIRDLFLRPPSGSPFKPDRVELVRGGKQIALHIEGTAPREPKGIQPDPRMQGSRTTSREDWPWRISPTRKRRS